MPDALDPRAWNSVLNAQIHNDARAATAISFDSRQVDATTAFAALLGETRHGNEFIDAALERGAPFILTDQDVSRAVRVPDASASLRTWARAWRDESAAQLIGVTGSAGKTTAKEMIAAALVAGKTPGNLNTLHYLACYLLSEVKPNSAHVLEMGIDRIGEMNDLMQLVAPNVGVITNVGPAHLEFFGSLERIASEKGRILAAPEGYVASGIAGLYPNVPSYGFAPTATHRGSDLRLGDSSSEFHYAHTKVRVASPSEKVAEAAVLGMALAERFQIPLELAAARLAAVQIPGGRMRLERGRYTLLDDSYNANPLSVSAALETLARYAGRRIAVLADMRELGLSAPDLHRQMGLLAAGSANLLVCIGRYASDYAAGAREAGLQALEFSEVESALPALLDRLEPGDVILVKGSLAMNLQRIAEVVRARL